MLRFARLLAVLVPLLALVAGACRPQRAQLGSEQEPIVMSFVPSGDTQEILASGEEIARLLEEKTGLSFETNVATSFAAVVEAMGTGKAHIGWLNTFSYLLAHEKHGVQAELATMRFGASFYTGQIFVQADSGITELSQLKGKKFCFVDPLSTSGAIIPTVELKAAGVDPDTDMTVTYAGSHNNAVLAVHKRECDAGASFVDARRSVAKETPEVMDTVVVIHESPPIPNDGVSFIKEFPAETRDLVVTALLELAESEEGQAALETLYEISGLQKIDNSFYDEFRASLEAAGVDVGELAGEG